jgi:hypothetical protein
MDPHLNTIRSIYDDMSDLSGRGVASLAPLDEASDGFLTVRYQPEEGHVSTENPPRFSWVPDTDVDAHYALTVEPIDASGGATYMVVGLAHNFHTPTQTFAAGQWAWSYCLWDEINQAPLSGRSRVRSFSVAVDAIACPGFNSAAFFSDAALSRPRLWLNGAEVTQLRVQLAVDATHLGWSKFFEQSVTPFVARAPVAEPAPYPEHKRELALWRQMYIDCQEVLYGIRHQAVAGVVLDDTALRANAKAWLLHAAAFDMRGTTARAYNDEAAFRIAAALAWGYDWLHDELSEPERNTVRSALATRLEEIAEHVIDHARIQMFPYDSHAVRAIGMVLIPCCIALLGEHPRAREWLDFSIGYYDTLYSPWGGTDGGWAEGPHYWTTALAYFSESANLLRKYTGHDVRRRAFFRNTGYFPLYTKSLDSARGCFCDDPTLGERPSLKVGYVLRDCAAATGNGWFQWYFDQVLAHDAGTENLYYNYGWWSLPFDDLCFRHDNAQVPSRDPADLPELRHFEQVGWVAVQRRVSEPARHVQLITKCSRYGSISHSHGDQGAFTFFAYGEDLAIQSGYYVGHNTTMHQSWRRQTRSKNAVLVGSRGQYAGADKVRQIQANGKVLAAMQRDDGVIHIRLDPSAAYRHHVPGLQRYERDLYLLPGDQLLVVDQIDLAEAQPLDWLLHTLSAPALARRSFRVTGAKAGLSGEIVFCASGAPSLSANVGFDGVAAAEIAGLAQHHQVAVTAPAATRHVLAILLTPHRLGENNRLFHFIDDQGFATHLYFQDAAGFSFNVTVNKAH